MRVSVILQALVGVGLFAAAASAQPAPSARPIPTPKPSLGTNLSGPADWNTELPFVDVFRLSRTWISQKQGEGWGKGPPLELDALGWVKKLEPNCYAESPLMTIEGGRFPKGQYTVFYKGKGKVTFNAAKTVSSEPGKMIIEPDRPHGIFLQIRETDPADPIRDIRVVMPGHETTYETQPFRPGFLDLWRGVTCIRFMDWQHTNNSTLAKWADRPTLEDATWTVKGVPVEVMIDLANELDADPWFCMPHLADDDFVRQFATLVKQKLEPERKVYVEYSNEVWNGQFQQSRWAGEQGIQLKFAEKPWEAAWKFTGYRSKQVFKIWEEVFGGTDRLVRCLPTQAANAYVSERVVEFQDAYQSADALAIAPYMTCNVPEKGDKLTAAEVEKWTVDQAMDFMEQTSLPETEKWLAEQKKTADKFGLKLVCYEAGQHMVGVVGGENNEAMMKLFHEANRSERMGKLYEKYYAAWEAAGGDLLCNFSSISNWSKWGSWGLMEYYDSKPSEYPKFVSTMNWAKKLGQKITPLE
jgi:hypothetical protein